MIKRIVGKAMLLVALFCSLAWAVDYAALSNDELFELRHAMQNVEPAEKQAYLEVWRKRVDAMPEEEKRKYSDILQQEQSQSQPFAIMGQGYEQQQGKNRIIAGTEAGQKLLDDEK